MPNKVNETTKIKPDADYAIFSSLLLLFASHCCSMRCTNHSYSICFCCCCSFIVVVVVVVALVRLALPFCMTRQFVYLFLTMPPPPLPLFASLYLSLSLSRLKTYKKLPIPFCSPTSHSHYVSVRHTKHKNVASATKQFIFEAYAGYALPLPCSRSLSLSGRHSVVRNFILIASCVCVCCCCCFCVVCSASLARRQFEF